MPDEQNNISNLILEQLRLVRREMADVRTVTLQTLDHSRRVERRMSEIERRIDELKDDLELMIKAELMGRLGNFEMQIEKQLDAMAERIGDRH